MAQKRGRFSLLVGVLLAAILLLYLVTFTVRANEKAIVTTFGRAGEPITRAGLYWKLPWPVQQVYRYDGRLRVYTSKLRQTLTADERYLIVSVAVGWSIDDARQFLRALTNEEKAVDRLRIQLDTVNTNIMKAHQFSDFISAESAAAEGGSGDAPDRFAMIEGEMLELLASEMSQLYGVGVEFVKITRLEMSEAVTEQVFARMREERRVLAEDLRAQGEGEAQRITAEADSFREKELADAEARAKAVMAEGDAAAAVHYDAFGAEPELAVFLRKLEALRKLKERTTVVVDTKTPPWDLLEGAFGVGAGVGAGGAEVGGGGE